MKTLGKKFERLAAILAILRGPNGCPWDKEQTYKDINPYMIEEVYEVMEAIDNNDFAELKEELGDLLMHICFHSQMAAEENRFTVADVIETQCEKLVRRHPHVFGNEKAETSEKVLENWEKIKQKERADKIRSERKTLLSGLPRALPALVRALRIGEKTHRVGFDWPETDGVLKKIDEEIAELKVAIASETTQIEHELGDVLFTVANLARHLKIDPETALRKTCDRFARRFEKIEQQTAAQNKKLQDLSAQEWDQFWNKAKVTE